MSKKPETNFRMSRVVPFLKTLTNTAAFPIQQISIRGVPDFLLCSRGTFVGLELKADNGSLSTLQEYNLKQIEKCGGVALMATPTNWPSVKAQLRKLDEGYDGNDY